MNLQKITLLLSLIGILILILLSQLNISHVGIISKIYHSQSKTTIQLKNQTENLIIFKKFNLNLKNGDKIKFQGNRENYKGKDQIIIKKISILS